MTEFVGEGHFSKKGAFSFSHSLIGESLFVAFFVLLLPPSLSVGRKKGSSSPLSH